MPTTDPFSPARLGPVELRNHVLKAATFEGMSRKNVVSESLVEFHRRMAAGGVAMTTVSYIAVSRNGMGAPAEIYVHDGAAEGLAHIAEVVHGEGARIAAQLGHAGAVGVLPGKKVVGPSKARTLMGTRVEAISNDGIDEVVEQFAAGGRLLKGCRLRFGGAALRSPLPHLGVHEPEVEPQDRRVRRLDREPCTSSG